MDRAVALSGRGSAAHRTRGLGERRSHEQVSSGCRVRSSMLAVIQDARPTSALVSGDIGGGEVLPGRALRTRQSGLMGCVARSRAAWIVVYSGVGCSAEGGQRVRCEASPHRIELRLSGGQASKSRRRRCCCWVSSLKTLTGCVESQCVPLLGGAGAASRRVGDEALLHRVSWHSSPVSQSTWGTEMTVRGPMSMRPGVLRPAREARGLTCMPATAQTNGAQRLHVAQGSAALAEGGERAGLVCLEGASRG